MWAVGAICSDLANQILQLPCEETQTLCKHIQDAVCEALEGLSLYDLALPASQQLLAEHKCLLIGLQKRAFSSVDFGVVEQSKPSHVIMLSALLWENSVSRLSSILQKLLQPEDAADQTAGEAYELTGSLGVLLKECDPCMTKWTQDRSPSPRSSVPAVARLDLLLELGMPQNAAIRASFRLQPDDERHIVSAMDLTSREQLLSYLRSQFSLASLTCASLVPLPPVVPCWVDVDASVVPPDRQEVIKWLGRDPCTGACIARIDTEARGRQVGGASWVESCAFYGADGKQIETKAQIQVRTSDHPISFIRYFCM